MKENEMITLTKDGATRTFSVHRLVAWHFIPNPHNLSQCNHKNEDTHNNHASNLEWVSPKENINYGTRNERAGEAKRNKPQNKGLVARLIEHEDGTLELLDIKRARDYVKDGFCGTKISRCCHGQQKTHQGFIFKYYVYAPKPESIEIA